MISLHVYMTPKANSDKELVEGICEKWMKAMATQPGFLRAGLLKPFSDGSLEKLQATKPKNTYEVVAFWRTEEERLAWVDKPMHDQVFNPLVGLVDDMSYTLKIVEHGWKLDT